MQRALPAFRGFFSILLKDEGLLVCWSPSSSSSYTQPTAADTPRRRRARPASTMAPSASLRVCDDGVAEVTLHNPPVNALHPDRASLPPPPPRPRAPPCPPPPGMLSWRPPVAEGG